VEATSTRTPVAHRVVEPTVNSMIGRENARERQRLHAIRARRFDFRSFAPAAGVVAARVDWTEAAGWCGCVALRAPAPARGARD
jgi:hypothetical protein